jgi:tRNA G18 (ribose-2'-O)-methylase SpoU
MELWFAVRIGNYLINVYIVRIDCLTNITSAPFSPACSKASAGAIEVTDLYYTNKMMKFLRVSGQFIMQLSTCIHTNKHTYI